VRGTERVTDQESEDKQQIFALARGGLRAIGATTVEVHSLTDSS
jgi:hypothetical protein